MSLDFADLVEAVREDLPEVRVCLMISRDGLPLAASPSSEEGQAMAAWSRLARLGQVERGFVQVEEELWAFCRHGAYGVLATAPATSRPGVLLDRLEMLLLLATAAEPCEETPDLPPVDEPASDIVALAREFAGLIPNEREK